MRMDRPLSGISAALLAALAACAARTASAEALVDAWQLAIAHDQGLAAVTSEVEGARAGERAARGARWPSVEATGGYTRLNASPALDVSTPAFTFRSGPIFKGDDYVNGMVQMKVPLYTGGQVSSGIDAARAVAVGASEEEHVALSALKLDVAQAYVGVLRARRSVHAFESSVASLTAHVADVQHMFDRELVPKSDLLAARVALANAQQAQVHSANAVLLAEAAYNRLLGEPLDRSPELDERLPVDAALAATPVNALVKQAIDSRSEIKGLAARADAVASQSRAELGTMLPQLALTGGYTHFENQILDRQDFSMVGLGFTWNLFDGGQARNRAASLRSQSHATRNRLEDLRSQIELDVRQAWLGVQEAQARVKASREAVAQADENLRMTRELYGAGMGTSTQVLEAVALQIEAVNNADNAQLDESLSRLKLMHSVGAL